MEILGSLYHLLLVQPVYNGLIALYATLGQQQSGVTLMLVGLLGAAIFVPLMIRGYYDQEKTKSLQQKIEAIQAEEPNPDVQQQKILDLLKKHEVRFQSESVFLFAQAIILVLLYPVLIQYWRELHLDLLYAFTPHPTSFSPIFGPIDVTHSSPTLSLVPAILLFFELRQSYQQQQFLTSIIDRWYPVLLPCFVYFLIFWLPSGLAVVLTTSLAVSLYVRSLLSIFTSLRQRPAAK